MPEGPFIVDDPHVALPPKEACYNQMESMIYHFKLIMDGIQVPAGERYSMVEGGQRRARLLRHQRRHRQALPPPRPAAVLPDLLDLPPADQRRLALRLDRLAGRSERHRRRARTMSSRRLDRRDSCERPDGRRSGDAPIRPGEALQAGLAERLYLPLLGGLMVTIRHFMKQPVQAEQELHHRVPGEAARLQPPLPRPPHPDHPARRLGALRRLLPLRARPARPSASTSRPASTRTSTSRSTRWSTRSTCCAASSAATAWTPARKRRSS